MKELIPSNKPNLRVLVDDEDFDFLNEVTWTAILDSKTKRHWYFTASNREPDGRQKHYRMHRLLVPAMANELVDHINGNTLDNRKQNLRICNRTENSRNGQKRCNFTETGSKYKGVRFDKNTRGKKKWSVKISFNHKEIWLGRYLTEEKAAMVYNAAAKLFYGDFARPNTIEGV